MIVKLVIEHKTNTRWTHCDQTVQLPVIAINTVERLQRSIYHLGNAQVIELSQNYFTVKAFSDCSLECIDDENFLQVDVKTLQQTILTATLLVKSISFHDDFQVEINS